MPSRLPSSDVQNILEDVPPDCLQEIRAIRSRLEAGDVHNLIDSLHAQASTLFDMPTEPSYRLAQWMDRLRCALENTNNQSTILPMSTASRSTGQRKVS